MSTKIYNGYVLKNMDLKKLQAFSLAFRKAIQEKAQELAARKAAEVAADVIDTFSLYGRERALELLSDYEGVKLGTTPSMVAFRTVRHKAREIERTQERDPEFDFTCEIALIPVRRKVFALFYAEQEEYREIWESLPGVEPYGYWNNTDRPEDVTAAQWRRRQKEWDEALPGIGVPSETAFVVKAVTRAPIAMDKDLPDNMPSLEARAAKHAEQTVYEKWIEADKAETLEDNENRPLDRYFRFRKWFRSEEGKARFAEASAEIAAKLKIEISESDLDEKVESFSREEENAQ